MGEGMLYISGETKNNGAMLPCNVHRSEKRERTTTKFFGAQATREPGLRAKFLTR